MPSRFPRTLLVVAVGLTALAGCGQPATGDAATAAESPGELALSLDAGGLRLNEVGYVILGPGGFTKAGNIDTSRSTQLAATIPGLPSGQGFTITLSAKSQRPSGSCAGVARFDIAPGVTTQVPVNVSCKLDEKVGSVLVGGVLNVCAMLDGLSAGPTDVMVGANVALTAVAHDSDAAPAAISYGWSATRGSLTSDGTRATWTCTEPGTVAISLTVSDGDPACQDSDSVTVTCSGDAAGGTGGTSVGGSSAGGSSGTGGGPGETTPMPAPLPSSFAGLLAAALLAVGFTWSRRAGGKRQYT